MRSRQGGAVVILSALTSALVSSCASVPARTVSAAGCYQFERNDGARALGLPWGVELLAEPLGPGWPLWTDVSGVRSARTATGPVERDDHPFGYWRVTAGDSIEIGHPGGGGAVLTLGPGGQDLVGRGNAAGDAVPLGGASGDRTPAPVVARRVLCGAS